ncbi:hypothetical protein OSCI_3720046 [Kamptonema sp. PCC 6506]|nr:hypothetical protein OSCI_3720046 [Kamptonema sp. PCC 6506]
MSGPEGERDVGKADKSEKWRNFGLFEIKTQNSPSPLLA